MWRKWAPLGYRILRISHILRAISRRGASAGARLSRFPLVTPEAAIRQRGGSQPAEKRAVNAHDNLIKSNNRTNGLPTGMRVNHLRALGTFFDIKLFAIM